MALTDGSTIKFEEFATFAIPPKTLEKSNRESRLCKLLSSSDALAKVDINDPISPTFSAVICVKNDS